MGQDCFSPTFFTLAALGLAGTAAAAALLQRCAGVYAAEYRELRSYDQEVLNHRGSGVAPGATSPLASPDGPR